MDLKTGDMVVCMGDYGKSDSIIRFVSGSKITHVGFIYVGSNGKVWIYESTVQHEDDFHKDRLSKKSKASGVMMVPFYDRLRTYKGKVFIRPIKKEFDREKVFRHYKRFSNVSFETSKLELLNSVLKLPINRNNLKEVFCSELAAELFKEFGVINKNDVTNHYTPKDIAEIGLGDIRKNNFYFDFFLRLKKNGGIGKGEKRKIIEYSKQRKNKDYKDCYFLSLLQKKYFSSVYGRKTNSKLLNSRD